MAKEKKQFPYIPADERIAAFRKDHDLDGAIETEVKHDFEKECAIVKATIKVKGVIIAQAHALAGDLGEEKELEKTEKTAIGRALHNAGYAASDTAEEENATYSKLDGKGKLGKKSSRFKTKRLKNSREEEEGEEDLAAKETESSTTIVPPKETGSTAKRIMDKYGIGSSNETNNLAETRR